MKFADPLKAERYRCFNACTPQEQAVIQKCGATLRADPRDALLLWHEIGACIGDILRDSPSLDAENDSTRRMSGVLNISPSTFYSLRDFAQRFTTEMKATRHN